MVGAMVVVVVVVGAAVVVAVVVVAVSSVPASSAAMQLPTTTAKTIRPIHLRTFTMINPFRFNRPLSRTSLMA